MSHQWPAQWGAAAMALAGWVMALGSATGWFSLMGAILPGLFWFRCPGRVFAVVTPLMALLAARGCDAIVEAEPRASGWPLWRVAVASACAACVVVPALVDVGDAFSWLAVFDRAWSAHREDLFAAAAFGALTTAVLALAARDRDRSSCPSAAMLLVVLLADFCYSNAANFWLESPQAADIPRDVLALGPPIRFVDAPYFPHVSAVSLHYCRLADTAVRNRRSMVGTDDGGILPGALDRFYRAVERDPRRALAIGACGYATHRGGSWNRLPGVLPRLRVATEKPPRFASCRSTICRRKTCARLRKTWNAA